jgi:hypothetical protein
VPRESSSDSDKKVPNLHFRLFFFFCTAYWFVVIFTSLSLSFGSASVSEHATAFGVYLFSVRSLQKISALFDLRDSQFKLHFSGLKCLVSVLTAKHS